MSRLLSFILLASLMASTHRLSAQPDVPSSPSGLRVWQGGLLPDGYVSGPVADTTFTFDGKRYEGFEIIREKRSLLIPRGPERADPECIGCPVRIHARMHFPSGHGIRSVPARFCTTVCQRHPNLFIEGIEEPPEMPSFRTVGPY